MILQPGHLQEFCYRQRPSLTEGAPHARTLAQPEFSFPKGLIFGVAEFKSPRLEAKLKRATSLGIRPDPPANSQLRALSLDKIQVLAMV